MHKLLCLALCTLLAQTVSAQDAEPASPLDRNEVARELGSLLAWRMGPESVEEWCRKVDPEGNAARAKAVKEWKTRNADLIKQVDERVAEVVPLVYEPPAGEEPVAAVHKQIKAIMHEDMVEKSSAEELRQNCQAEAKPDNPRWKHSSVREVQQALAALYDWKVQLEKK